MMKGTKGLSSVDRTRDKLRAGSELPVAVSIGLNGWSVCGHFPLRRSTRPHGGQAVLNAIRRLLQSTGRELTLPDRLGAATGCEGRDGVTWWWPQKAGSVPIYGCGLAATVSRGEIVAVSARWSRTRVKPAKPNASAAVALMCAHMTLEEPQAPAPEVPAPILAFFDPAAVWGTAGAVEPVWVFGLGGEQGTDVIVAADGTRILDTIVVDLAGDALTLTQTPRYLLHPVHGTPRFVSFEPHGLLVPEAATLDPTQVALGFFRRYPQMFGTWDASNQLLVDKVVTEPVARGMRTVVLRQQMGPFPVWGAQLRVHLTPDLAIRSISGSYVHETQADLRILVSEAAARSHAFAVWGAYGGDRVGSGVPVQHKGLVIVPIRLDRDAARSLNQLCYWFRFPDADRFVSSVSGRLVYEASRARNARFVYNAMAATTTSGATLQLEDGVARVPVSTLDPDARPADDAMAATEAFWRVFGRDGLDGRGAHSFAFVNFNFDDPTTVPVEMNSAWDGKEVSFSPGFGSAPSVVAHEMTHGLIDNSCGLMYKGEGAALHESMSDVFGVLIAPSPAPNPWRVGWTPAGGVPIRDLQLPTISNYAQYGTGRAGLPASGRYENSGISSWASVILCDGDGTTVHTGIGRPRLSRVLWELVTARLFPWATFFDFAANLGQVARDLIDQGRTGVQLPGTTGAPPVFDAPVAGEVAWALRTVGLDLTFSSGWFILKSNFTTSVSFFSGEVTPTGYVVGDAGVRVVRRRGDNSVYFDAFALVSTGGSISDAAGSITATITGHGVGTASRQIDATIMTPGGSFVEVAPYIRMDAVPGAPPPPPVPVANPTPSITHWFDNPFFAGRRYGDIIYETVALDVTAGCNVDDLILQLYDKNWVIVASQRLGEPAAVWGGTGAYITSWAMNGPGLEAHVRSWHDFGWAVRYRLVYMISGGCVPPSFGYREVGANGV